jgi:PDDEXK-like domain of unknown function (DUF3799)
MNDDFDNRPAEVIHPLVYEPGVFFGLPEDEYRHALALSSSGIKNLRQSTLDFWMRSPLSADQSDEESEAKIVGHAYHKRIIEGRAAFEASYAPEIHPGEFPGALRTNDEIRAAIIAAGGPNKRTKSLRKAELIELLLTYQPDALIWDQLVATHNRQHDGKIFLPEQLVHKIEIAAAMIERHPQLSKAFTGGAAEVSIFWTDRVTGVPCKARLDYWKPKAIVDLKSFENSLGLPVRKAIARAVANYRYHLQAAFYLRAVGEARRLIDAGAWHGDVSPELVKALAQPNEMTWLWVWQQKGVAPLARGMVLGCGSVMDIARMEIHEALLLFARCWKIYGAEPWVDIADIDTFDDTEFPAFIAD